MGRGVHVGAVVVWRQEDSLNWVAISSTKRIMRKEEKEKS